MFVVFRNQESFGEVWRNEVKRFDNQADADAFADECDRLHPWSDVWHSVEEEV